VSEIKLTKNELRAQQQRLSQLQKYLPTLQLKKAMLQAEVSEARVEIARMRDAFELATAAVDDYVGLLREPLPFDLRRAGDILELRKEYENIAGVEIPIYRETVFADVHYLLFNTPPWVDGGIFLLRKRGEAQGRLQVAEEKLQALDLELREVSIRVNLFEKVLIPRAQENIKRIRVFLGDQQLAAVAQAKVAKEKIVERKLMAKASHAS
jgi:V/A-type H+/Na+-transporting ATPase subunit D